jgi:membrane-bound lytic murein transglycosylase D
MEPIAEDLGLEVYDEVDERYHVEKATQAACQYLHRLHDRFGNWINAAAAYNVGPTNFSKHLKDQNQEHYFDLNINDETMRYVFRLVALKTILENPEAFGYQIPMENRYPPLENYYTIRVDTTVTSLGKLAADHGISYRMLKIYNPWLRSHELTVKSNTYFLKIPKNGNPGTLQN